MADRGEDLVKLYDGAPLNARYWTTIALGIVSSIFARQSASWFPSSRTVYSGLAVVQQPPAAMAPWKAIAYSGTLGR